MDALACIKYRRHHRQGAVTLARLLLLLWLLLLLAGCGHRQLKVNEPEGSDFFILQNNQPVAVSAATRVALLKSAPFTIVTRHASIALVLVESGEALSFVAPGIDAAAEHRSPFYVWRAYPADSRGTALVVGGEGANLLTPENGLRLVRERLYAYTVRELYDAGRRKFRPLSGQTAPLKAAVWIDKNGDLIMDANELGLLELVFTIPQTSS
jgi:hypothetical protein